MYHIHRTPAIVAKLKPSGEADMLVELCTRDYGTILAIAKGLRRETSKLRYRILELEYIYAELVRGKEFWRLTSAVPILEGDQYFKQPLQDKEAKKTIARIIDLWRRLGGENPLPQVFDDICFAEKFLRSKKEFLPVESAVVLRMLASLGYIDTSINLPLHQKEIDEEILQYTQENLTEIIKSINKAISASHL